MLVDPLVCKMKPTGVQVLCVTGVLVKCLSLMAFSLTLGRFSTVGGTVIAFQGNNVEYFHWYVVVCTAKFFIV